MLRQQFRVFFAAALIVILVLAGAIPASAGGPLAVCDSGVPYLWPSGGVNIPFNPDQGNLGPLTNAQAVALVQESFDAWAAVPSATATYANAGPLPVDVDINNFFDYLFAPAPDGQSAIVFDDTGEIFDLLYGPGSGILGFAGPEWGDSSNCTILEGLSFLNGPAFTDATYAKDVMVHEFGHYTNLAHTVVNGQVLGFGDASGPAPNNTFTPVPNVADDVIETMYPFYFGPGSGTQTLEKDDTTSLSELYPEASYAGSTATISGTIFAPNGTTKLTGVNVIARNVANPFEDAVSALSSDYSLTFDQSDPYTGVYTLTGLTPGAQYAVYVDEVLAGGFSTPPLFPLPGPEEFYNGANESSNGATDNPSVYTAVSAAAGGTASGVNIIFNRPTPGVPLPLGDDSTIEIFMPFSFSICGQTFSSVWVNSNGNLTFGQGNFDFSESPAEFLFGPPRIAGWWDDLNPSAGGTVIFNYDANKFWVRYENVPEYLATGANTFDIVLMRSSNHIDLKYGAMSAVDGLAGVSCGGAITSGSEAPVDLTSFGNKRINLQTSTAMYEVFSSAHPNDLANRKVLFNGTAAYNDNWAEPNNTLAKARAINLPFNSTPLTKFTEIEPLGNDVDFYRVRLDAGRILVAQTSGILDPVMGLYDAAGNLVAFDDDGGPGLQSRVIYSVGASGIYRLAVSTFPDYDFTGDGAGPAGRYVLDVRTTDTLQLSLTDESWDNIPIGFTFPYQGANWTDVWVNSNGSLTFGEPDPVLFEESLPDFLAGPPRIAGLWDDLDPGVGGQVNVTFGPGSVTIDFTDVPEWDSSTANTFGFRLAADGSVRLTYGNVEAADGIVGVTEGGGVADPGPTNLSAGGPFSAAGTTYELFDGIGNAFDLDNQVIDFAP